jgi:prepilin-type N-terminal cleavage/methylation domain-containing protein
MKKLRLNSQVKKAFKGSSRGFTLIELVIVIGLTGLISGGITLTIMQVFNMNTRTRDDMIAVYQVRQAGKMVSEDILQAQSVNNAPGVFLNLTWSDWATGHVHNVIYTLADVPSSELKILWREHYVKEDGGFELDSITKVAEYIDPDQTSCVWAGGVLNFTVTATVGQQSETRVYQIKSRPGS